MDRPEDGDRISSWGLQFRDLSVGAAQRRVRAPARPVGSRPLGRNHPRAGNLSWRAGKEDPRDLELKCGERGCLMRSLAIPCVVGGQSDRVADRGQLANGSPSRPPRNAKSAGSRPGSGLSNSFSSGSWNWLRHCARSASVMTNVVSGVVLPQTLRPTPWPRSSCRNPAVRWSRRACCDACADPPPNHVAGTARRWPLVRGAGVEPHAGPASFETVDTLSLRQACP
jgi:hypothetical protein